MGWRDEFDAEKYYEVSNTESNKGNYEPEKESLFKRAKRFAKDHALEIGLVVVGGLAYAMSKGDYEPNLEKDDPGTVKLLDEPYRDPREDRMDYIRGEINKVFDDPES